VVRALDESQVRGHTATYFPAREELP
jgi:hypothetical protein